MRDLTLLCLLLAACAPSLSDDDDASGDDDAAEDDDTADDDDVTGDDDTGDDDSWQPGPCVDADPTLPICILFEASSETYSLATVAAGVSIPFAIVVEDAVDSIVPLPQDGGQCGQPNASGLTIFEQITGNSQQWCRCDVGRCAGPDMTERTIPAGSTPGTFQWTGRNWFGPSDTGMPEGDPFPAGSYTLEISAIGLQGGVDFRVSGTTQIVLTE
jgi:hypothetical protein